MTFAKNYFHKSGYYFFIFGFLVFGLTILQSNNILNDLIDGQQISDLSNTQSSTSHVAPRARVFYSSRQIANRRTPNPTLETTVRN